MLFGIEKSPLLGDVPFERLYHGGGQAVGLHKILRQLLTSQFFVYLQILDASIFRLYLQLELGLHSVVESVV